MKGYDYSKEGAYFITIVTYHRECVFGNIFNGEIKLNNAGLMIKKWWNKLNDKFSYISNDVYIIMPNHIHGVIHIGGEDLHLLENRHIGLHLHKIVQWFKTMTTNEYIHCVKQFGWKNLNGKLWHRNYYEHIIINENELYNIYEYIINNPLQWELDRENPFALLDPQISLIKRKKPWES
jgi:REP element-mobilizing transposase RayT